METISLQSVTDANLEAAATNPGGHSATTVYGGSGHRLRQTLLALTAGSALSEHTTAGEATLFVLDGTVRIDAGQRSWEAASGDLVAVPSGPHSLHALETSVLLLTVALPG